GSIPQCLGQYLCAGQIALDDQRPGLRDLRNGSRGAQQKRKSRVARPCCRHKRKLPRALRDRKLPALPFSNGLAGVPYPRAVEDQREFGARFPPCPDAELSGSGPLTDGAGEQVVAPADLHIERDFGRRARRTARLVDLDRMANEPYPLAVLGSAGG